jgi:ribosomal protein S6--L-glutamate ligase
VFYGKRQKASITDYFGFPFIGKIPRGSAMGRGVYLIEDPADLDGYLEKTHTAYIQAFLPIDRDMRIVVIGKKIVHAYWRIAAPGEYRTNLAVGGTVRLDNVPAKALELALHIAHNCQWDDVGIDICEYNGRYYVLEANMKYGREGFRAAGIDYNRLMEDLIENEEI